MHNLAKIHGGFYRRILEKNLCIHSGGFVLYYTLKRVGRRGPTAGNKITKWAFLLHARRYGADAEVCGRLLFMAIFEFLKGVLILLGTKTENYPFRRIGRNR